ncbi:MAG: hypothetical protein RIM99_04835 [Cyclobacteriaceae bacterium]
MFTKSNVYITILFFFLISTLNCQAGTEGKEEEFEKAQTELENAVADQNYKHARESLYELFPIMEEDIKYTKKTLGVEKKAKNVDVAEDLKENLNRKKEILDTLDHIMHASPAALRVQANKAMTLVAEFKKLSFWPKTT